MSGRVVFGFWDLVALTTPYSTSAARVRPREQQQEQFGQSHSTPRMIMARDDSRTSSVGRMLADLSNELRNRVPVSLAPSSVE